MTDKGNIQGTEKKEPSTLFSGFGTTFGQKPLSGTSNDTQPSFGSFQFGKPTTTSLSTKSEGSATSGTTGFGFSFGDQSTKTSQPQSGFSFGNVSAQQPSGGFSFGSTVTTAPVTTSDTKPSTEAKTPIFSFGGQPPSTQITDTFTNTDKDKKEKANTLEPKTLDVSQIKPTSTKDSTAIAPTIQSTIQNKTLDEIIQKWVKELDAQVKLFHQRSIELNRWDKLLMEQGNKIAQLYDVVIQAETMQTELDQNLDYLASQQNELAGMLTLLENDVKKIYEQPPPTATNTEAGISDSDREKMFSLAESIDTDLSQLKQGMTTLNEQLNSILQPKTSPIEEVDTYASDSVS